MVKKAGIVIIAVQILALILILIINPSIGIVSWVLLLFFFVLTLLFGILASAASRRAQQNHSALEKQLEESVEQYHREAIHDPVTKLFTRRYFEETFERELHRSLRERSSIGLILIDIDHYKEFYATNGDAVTNVMLKKLAEYMQESVRVSDIACRYGIDEFVLVMNDATRDLTLERAEHLRAQVQKLRVEYVDQEIKGITISVGVAIYPVHGTTMDALMKHVTSALEQAKAKGRNCVVLYQ